MDQNKYYEHSFEVIVLATAFAIAGYNLISDYGINSDLSYLLASGFIVSCGALISAALAFSIFVVLYLKGVKSENLNAKGKPKSEEKPVNKNCERALGIGVHSAYYSLFIFVPIGILLSVSIISLLINKDPEFVWDIYRAYELHIIVLGIILIGMLFLINRYLQKYAPRHYSLQNKLQKDLETISLAKEGNRILKFIVSFISFFIVGYFFYQFLGFPIISVTTDKEVYSKCDNPVVIKTQALSFATPTQDKPLKIVVTSPGGNESELNYTLIDRKGIFLSIYNLKGKEEGTYRTVSRVDNFYDFKFFVVTNQSC